jgi:hypothetical protein
MMRYRLNISETISTSVSAAAIFSAEDGCARPPPNMNDILDVRCGAYGRLVWVRLGGILRA